MSRHVELRNDPHASIRGVRHELADIGLRIKRRRRTFLQLRIETAFDAEPLVVAEVESARRQMSEWFKEHGWK